MVKDKEFFSQIHVIETLLKYNSLLSRNSYESVQNETIIGRKVGHTEPRPYKGSMSLSITVAVERR